MNILKMAIVPFMVLFLVGCARLEPKNSSAVALSIKSPILRINDAGFIHIYQNGINLQLYSSGVIILDLKIRENICINASCDSRESFNEKFFKSAHYPFIIDDILLKRAIFDGENLIKTECGFTQEIAVKSIKYEVCENYSKFSDTKNGVKIIMRELQ